MSQPLIATAPPGLDGRAGVFARYPALRVLFLGAGLSWFTHILLRMDKEYNENRRDVSFYSDRSAGTCDGRSGWGPGRSSSGWGRLDSRRSCASRSARARSSTGAAGRSPSSTRRRRSAGVRRPGASRDGVLGDSARALFGIAVN